MFVFKPSTGEIEYVLVAGTSPGFTTLTTTGTFWLVLCDGSLSIIPTWDPGSYENVSGVAGSPLSSANMVIPPSVRYALYTAAGIGETAVDRVYQHDFITGAVVGSYLVGDDPNVSLDQASSLALTPDSRILAVLNYASNQLNLLADATILKQTKFSSEREKFTGVSVVNLSDAPANLTFTAIADFGSEYTAIDIVNPVKVQVAPNAQVSLDVSHLFNLNPDDANSGYLTITSDQPAVAGFSNTGRFTPTI